MTRVCRLYAESVSHKGRPWGPDSAVCIDLKATSAAERETIQIAVSLRDVILNLWENLNLWRTPQDRSLHVSES